MKALRSRFKSSVLEMTAFTEHLTRYSSVLKYWEAHNPCFIHHGVSYKHYNSKISVLTVLHSEYLRSVDHDVLAIKVEVYVPVVFRMILGSYWALERERARA